MTVIWLFYLFGLFFAEITIKIRFEEHSNAMALVFVLNWFKRPYLTLKSNTIPTRIKMFLFLLISFHVFNDCLKDCSNSYHEISTTSFFGSYLMLSKKQGNDIVRPIFRSLSLLSLSKK